MAKKRSGEAVEKKKGKGKNRFGKEREKRQRKDKLTSGKKAIKKENGCKRGKTVPHFLTRERKVKSDMSVLEGKRLTLREKE